MRNVYDFDCAEKTSFWCVIKDTFGGMEELSSKTRNMVRRAIKTLDYKLITPSKLISDGGYEVMKRSCDGYKVKSECPSRANYEKHIMRLTNRQVWGCYLKETDRMVAYAICNVYQDICDAETCKCDPSFLKHYYPYYGLFYVLGDFYLKQCGLKYIFDGTRTVTEHSNIQNFLEEKFKFRKAYCRLQIRYKLWMKIVVYLLYPFRKVGLLPLKVRGVLNMEAMKRGKM